MIQCQIKLRLNGKQKRKQLEWLPILGSIFNFGIRKIELNAKDKVYFSKNDFQNLLTGHSKRLGIPSQLVAENKTICFLQDNHRAIVERFGKSVSDSAHGGLRQMLSYKSLIGGTELVFPENRNSTRICSTCGARSGPTGLARLNVRNWTCTECGTPHDRDQNAAINAVQFWARMEPRKDHAHA